MTMFIFWSKVSGHNKPLVFSIVSVFTVSNLGSLTILRKQIFITLVVFGERKKIFVRLRTMS